MQLKGGSRREEKQQLMLVKNTAQLLQPKAIFWLKMHKKRLATGPSGAAYSAPTVSLARLKGGRFVADKNR